MFISCGQQDFFRAVQIVNRAVSARTTMPILSNILLESVEEGLRLTATDLELGIQTFVAATVEEGGAITLPARLLSEIAASLPQARVQLRVEHEANRAEIQCEETVFEILGLPAADFPLLPAPEVTEAISLEASLLRGMIRQTVFAVSTDETRPFLTGVHVVVEDRTVRFVATDGGRLSLRCATLDQAVRQNFGVIVPAKTMHELARLATGAAGAVAMALAENHLVFTLPEARLVSRLIAGQFPNYEQVIPQGFKQRLRLQTERFLRAVRRAAITARDSANVVRLSARGSELTITSNTPEVGKTVERLPVDAEGETVEIAFNARYLMDCLSVLEADEVTFELSGPLSPGAIRPVGQQDYVYVLAPVRVYA
ncbi:MAG: DNA polymerase III subunit beta [Armatimonadota bacterium]|nr:DNA polymerase III subunit beta [Armatimonadota bacterium]MDR7463551.1 DNA polymerase III subunit beta [Armatimonadota bacterium]